MSAVSDIKRDIVTIVAKAIELGLVDAQNFPSERRLPRGLVEVSFPGSSSLSLALKDTYYEDLYRDLLLNKAYSFRLADGAIVQMSYLFSGEEMVSHRLAFFPSPFLGVFQNDPEIYLDDEIFAEVLKKSVVVFPIRFDFDADDGRHVSVDHPKAHATFGEYENCRIPVSGPLTPSQFTTFILRNFYNTISRKYCDQFIGRGERFPETIDEKESSVMYLAAH